MSRAVTPSAERALPGKPPLPQREPLPDPEREFYQGYAWCLNPFPTVRETVGHLGVELDRLARTQEAWQTGEVLTNVYLLSGALLNAVEEYLRGKTLRLPGKLAAVRPLRAARWAAEKLAAVRRLRRRAHARGWRERWLPALDAFLSVMVSGEAPDPTALAEAGRGLGELLRSPLPAELQAEHISFPSAFRRLDLTHHDLLTLGRHFVQRFPDRRQPVLFLGLRTAGSYFAPLLRAFLKAAGYAAVAAVTVHPVKGPGAEERAELTRRAREGYRAVILDDPPHTGDTLVTAVDLARRAGFAPDKVVVLVPAHPARRDWGRSLSLSDTVILSLDPEEWHKHHLLDPQAVEGRLAEYFRRQGFTSVRLVPGGAAESLNARLQRASEDARRARLKRVYEVRLETADGSVETRYVVAKSVGWGWLGYHAFLAGHRLAGFVPPLLGLRDGILYSEWVSAGGSAPDADRAEWIRTVASYAAARVRTLSLGKDLPAGLGLHRHHAGFGLLEKVLSRAYGRSVVAGLMRPRVRQRLAGQPCPLPTLIDGKMQRSEWVAGPGGLVKTDYEHHGLGKDELNAIDPAYDLADAMLQLGLSEEEEDRLLRSYVAESGDDGVASRLFLNKLLAGTWAMASALKGLFEPAPVSSRQRGFHQEFVNAWHFLTVQTAQFCGGFCRPPATPCWHSPLAVLDLDGVLDRRLFGFPCTTAAGIQALALLHGHGFAVAVDTARTVAEVQEYCRAYGLVGGVAEYGSYVWDAVGQRGRVLVSPESLRQLDRARKALEQLPGVFLDDRYQYSVRACTYEDTAATLSRLPIPSPLRALLALASEGKGPAPLPVPAVQEVLAAQGLDRLCVQQTTIDTTLRAREVDKGSGLSALLSWVGQAEADTFAVGDSEPDLPMFRVARHRFAPAQMSGARLARLLGCRIARHRYQRGLLDIVRTLVHPDGGRCPRCAAGAASGPADRGLFLDLLRAADRQGPAAFLRALLDPLTYRVFLR
jgi:hydroxymethylpyrimidine pyrophosphatase-like HAD family hydrolase